MSPTKTAAKAKQSKTRAKTPAKAAPTSKKTAPAKTKAGTAAPSAAPGLDYAYAPALSDEAARQICKDFGKAFHERHTVLCYLLDFLPVSAASAGLELAAFRRAELLREYCSVESWLLTNYYQPGFVANAVRQIKLGRLSIAHVANLYDFAQGINRQSMKKRRVDLVLNSGWKISPVENTRDYVVFDSSGQQLLYVHQDPQDGTLDFVNYVKDGKIVRRDTYDPLGFLSRTELIDPADGAAHSAIFFRPDRTIALIETYRKPTEPGARQGLETVNILDKNGFTIQRFGYRDELIAWWLLQLLHDPQSSYLCVADQIMDYQRYFVELERQKEAYPNVRVVGVAHSCHCVDPQDTLNSQIGDNYRFLCDVNQRVDRVVTLTPWQKADVEERFKEQAKVIDVIPHAIPTAPAAASTGAAAPQEPAQPPLPAHSIALIGRYAPGKNHELAYDLIRQVRRKVPDATLHFYGSGPLEEELKKKASEQGLDDVVFFHGFLADLRPVYTQAALLLSLSRFEGFSLVILEALTQGCPVVAFDVRYGPRALIEDGKSGFLVPTGDVKAAAQRVCRILQDDKLRKSLSEEAAVSVKRFAPLQIAALWARTLHAVLEDRITPA